MREIYHLIRGSRMTRGSIFVLCAAPHAAMLPPRCRRRRSAIARAFHGLARPLWKWLTLTKRNCRITAPFFAPSSSLLNFTLALSSSSQPQWCAKVSDIEQSFMLIIAKRSLETYFWNYFFFLCLSFHHSQLTCSSGQYGNFWGAFLDPLTFFQLLAMFLLLRVKMS